jgi:hypothetical protein
LIDLHVFRCFLWGQVLPTIPADQRARVARFLEKQNFKEQALKVSNDPDHRFELALQLNVWQPSLFYYFRWLSFAHISIIAAAPGHCRGHCTQ